MLALLSTLAIQALVSMTVLTPPVLAALAAPGIGVLPERIGIFTAIVYGGAIVTSSGSGSLLRRFGALRLSQWSLVLCMLGLMLAATGSLPILILGAFIMGCGYGPVTPASSHILIRQTPPERRSLVFSLKQTGVPVGGALAGFVAAPLAIGLGWQGSALVVAALCFLLALAVEPLRPRFDADEGPRGATRGGFLTGIALVLRIPALRRLALSSIAFAATQLSFATFVVTFLTNRAEMPFVTAGVVMAVAQVAGIFGRIVCGWLADRYVSPRRVLGALGISMAAAALVTGLISPAWPLAGVFLVTIVLGTTAISWNGVYLAEVAQIAPAGTTGAATGGALALTFLGIVMGPALFSTVVSLSGSYALAFAVVAAGALIGGLAVWRRPKEV